MDYNGDIREREGMCRIEREGEGEGRDKEMRDFYEEMMVYV